jgi:hypothetical protein
MTFATLVPRDETNMDDESATSAHDEEGRCSTTSSVEGVTGGSVGFVVAGCDDDDRALRADMAVDASNALHPCV